uniref:Uncharacterized protein n=1 Tax=Arundo donax TaxID=35708 RepID=A0A0A8Z9Z6_ARUDO
MFKYASSLNTTPTSHEQNMMFLPCIGNMIALSLTA